jgi:hypothetical protein
MRTSKRTGFGQLLIVAVAVIGLCCGNLNAFAQESESGAIDARSLPTHEQVGVIQVPGDISPLMLHTFCLAPNGNLLVATGGERVASVFGDNGRRSTELFTEDRAILVISSDGEQLATWNVEMTPQAFDVAEDGTIFVGGDGRLARLSSNGIVEKMGDSPNAANLRSLPAGLEVSADPAEETEEEKNQREAELARLRGEQKIAIEARRVAADEYHADETDEEKKQKFEYACDVVAEINPLIDEFSISPKLHAVQRRSAAMQTRSVKSIAVDGDDVFVCCQSVGGYMFDVWRTDRDFTSSKKIVTGLRGCCGNMYIQADEGKLWVAENARKRVIAYDRNGEELAEWGSSDRNAIDGFGDCCNPMCIRIDPDGNVYTAEANLGHIKRFSPEGEFLGILGTAEILQGCKHFPIGISPTDDRVYMLNMSQTQVIVLEPIAP